MCISHIYSLMSCTVHGRSRLQSNHVYSFIYLQLVCRMYLCDESFLLYNYIIIIIIIIIVPLARISLTLSRHFSILFIASGRSSGLLPVSSQSCWTFVRAGRPAFARPSVGVYWSTSLMSSSLLLQQCPACLVRLAWIVFVMGGKWPYSWCLVGVAARTCSILLAAFLCNSRLASSPAV